MNSYFNENTYEELIDEIKYVYQSDNRPWIIGYSGGKDSTTVVELVYEMLMSMPPEQRTKNVYIVSSDTLIENPLIKIYLNRKLLQEHSSQKCLHRRQQSAIFPSRTDRYILMSQWRMNIIHISISLLL